MAQQRGGAEAGPLGDAVDVQIGLLEHPARVEHPLIGDPLHGCGAGLLDEAARERARRHVGPPGQAGHRVRLVEIGQYPIQLRGKAFRTSRGYGLLDVLALTAVTLRWHHHPSRDDVGDRAAEFTTDQVQARVDAGGSAGAGHQITVVDEQHIAVDDRGRIATGEFVGMHPVRRAAAPVEQARLPRDERAGTHGQDRRPGGVGCPQGLQRLGRVGLDRARDRRHRHHVGTHQGVEAVVGHQLSADTGAQRLARFGTAHLEIEVGHAVAGPVDAEDLADDPELEDR